MTPAPESPDAAREPGWRFQIVSDGDVRAYAPNGESWLVRAGTGEAFYEFVHALFTHLATAPDITRLTAERDAALRDAERLRNVALAADDYFSHYLQDEASEPDLCVCGEEQHERAVALRDALQRLKDHRLAQRYARAALSAQERGNV